MWVSIGGVGEMRGGAYDSISGVVRLGQRLKDCENSKQRRELYGGLLGEGYPDVTFLNPDKITSCIQ